MNEADVPARLFNQELKLRVISALVLAAIVLLITWIGGYTFNLLWAVIALVVFYEFLRICGDAIPISIRFAGYIAIGLVLLTFLVGQQYNAYWIAGGAFFAFLVWELLINRSIWTCIGFAYATLPFLAMSELRGSDEAGLLLILVLFGCVWGADILAYFFGRTLGGPKLAPRISPKKTWSGFVGSLVGGVGLSVLVLFFFGVPVTSVFVGIVLVLTIVSQIGDLIESFIKRRFEVKDSSKLIPGHGGVLDRIDGLIPAGIVLWTILIGSSNETGYQFSYGIIFRQAFLAP